MDELEYERRLSHLEDRAKSNSRRLDKMEKVQETLTDLVQSVATIAQKQVDMDTDMKEVKADVKSIAGKPAKRWEGIVEKALLTAVAALMSWCMFKMGIG